MPVSLTATSTCELTRSRRTWILPPLLVNFTAFDSRFHITCCRRSGSPAMGAADGSSTVSTRTPFASAASVMTSMACRTTSGNSTACTFRRSLPDTMREMSSTSSTICVKDVAFRSIVSMLLSRFSGGTMPERRMRAYPRIALSGVRSSCERLARKSSLMRLVSWTRAYRRAFSSATDAQDATPSARC
jgi:hypothetical protein